MTESTEYQPPKVWSTPAESGGRYGNINRPEAGARYEAELPRGQHPLQLYSLATPNGQKVTIMLEELLAAGVKEAEYDAHLIRIMEQEQFSTGFVAINPNSRIPALVDYSETPPVRVFESGASCFTWLKSFSISCLPITLVAPKPSIGCSGCRPPHHT